MLQAMEPQHSKISKERRYTRSFHISTTLWHSSRPRAGPPILAKSTNCEECGSPFPEWLPFDIPCAKARFADSDMDFLWPPPGSFLVGNQKKRTTWTVSPFNLWLHSSERLNFRAIQASPHRCSEEDINTWCPNVVVTREMCDGLLFQRGHSF